MVRAGVDILQPGVAGLRRRGIRAGAVVEARGGMGPGVQYPFRLRRARAGVALGALGGRPGHLQRMQRNSHGVDRGLSFPRPAVSADPASPASDGPRGGAPNTKAEPCPAKPVRKRLAKGKAALEHIEEERERRGDPRFGQTTEDRIVWNELIELELQEIDEQVSRICGPAGQSPRAPSPSNLREGGSHEHNDK